MAHCQAYESHCDQMRSVAESLKPSGSRFDSEISYEINGCVLTWIANDAGSEHRFDCSNIIEIIDGYYKAEFYLDTKRVFEVPQFVDTYHDDINFELTAYTPEDIAITTTDPKRPEKRRKSKSDTASASLADPDSVNDTPASKKRLDALNTGTAHSKLSNGTDTKGSKSTTNGAKGSKLSTVEKHSKSDRSKDKSSTPSKKTMETRLTASQASRGSRANRTQQPTTNIYARETTRSINPYSRPTVPKHEPAPAAPESKKRKYTKTDPAKKPEVEVRRGERIRKVSIFQDCYIPASRNEWISEVFIGAHKENF